MLEPQSTQPKLSELLTLLEKECSRVLINWEKELDSDEEYLRTIPFSVYNWQQSFCYSVPNKNVQSELWNSIFSFVSRFFHVNFLQNEDIKYGTSAVLALKLDKLGPANHLLVDAAVASSYDLTKMTQGHTSLLSFAMSQTSVINAGTLMAEIYVVDESKDKIKQLQQCSEVERPYISISCSQSFCDTFFNDVENQLLGEWLSTEADFTKHGIHLQCGGGINSSEVTNSLVWMILHYWKQCCISLKEQDNKFEKSQLETYKFVSYFASSSHSNPHVGIMVPFFVRNNDSSDVTGSLLENVFIAARLLGTSFLVFTSTIRAKKEGIEEKRRLRAAYTKSAIGAIMSRNGSHNIGSHVLSALSHNVGTMPDDRVLYQYIQHRMDYIASATTGAPDWSVPTPFVGNLMKLFYSQRHLLDHIAESDGLHAYQYQGKGTLIGVGQKNCVKIVVRKVKRYKEGKKGNPTLDVYEFFPDAFNMSVNWGEDESVSIPGGILGQHAFYNIVENVLRNAAKHSWAGKSEKERRGTGNLEIYVDFEEVQTDGTMCFTVGDNMSKVFQDKFWDGLFAEFNDSPDKFWERLSEDESKEFTGKSLPRVFAQPLDGFIVPPEADSNCRRIKEFLKGKEKADSLPPQYKALYAYVKDNWNALQEDSLFVMSLKGVCDKDSNGDWIRDQIGHRLPLPLHHRQELALSEPFINLETNRLRQSAWGLSEMKISAGYLCRAGVSVIGGLKSVPGKPPLIVPMGIPPSEDRSKVGTPRDGKFDKLRYEDLCLAYRFWVKLPKDVLIVADREDDWKKFCGEGWERIGVASYASVFGEGETKGDIGKMSDYGFVLVDHDGDLGEDALKLPFRSLRIDGAEAQASVAKNNLAQASNANAFLACVYSAWLGHLKKLRSKKDLPNLTIRLNIYDKKGAEKGLITDKDIYKVLFRECLHSVLEPITVDVSISPPQRKALLLVSLYPLDVSLYPLDEDDDEDDDLFKGDSELFSGNHRLNIEGLLRKIAAKARYYWTSVPCSSEEDCAKWRRLTDAYRVGLERAVETMRYPKIAKELLSEVNTQPGSTVRYGDTAFLRELDAMAEGSSESRILEAAAQALDVARTTSDVFLRKYEERIVTLPPQYKGSVKSNDKTLDFSRFGVKIVFSGDADISYNRHAMDDAPLYSEPLSGSQTYLNALANLSDKDEQWAMRLAENGLLRIVIIDERVRAFVVEHGEEIRKTYESMHIAVVDTEKKPILGQDGTSLPAFDDASWNYVAGGSNDPHFDSDFDLVVIHQGIIDKWWTDHSQDAVSEILNNLRKRKDSAEDRFVVVTTGRGRPDNIPDNAKVLAFSSIETFLFKRYPEKLNLVNSLMSILPGSPERNDDND